MADHIAQGSLSITARQFRCVFLEYNYKQEQFEVHLPTEGRLCLHVGDHYNPLFGQPGLNPHADTPCKILHTILLRVDKYLWADTTVFSKWPTWKDAQFAARLESLSIDGLSLHSF
jgi:hypothetical protein